MAASWPLAIFSGPTNRWIWPRAAPTATVSGTRVSMAKKDISAAGPVDPVAQGGGDMGRELPGVVAEDPLGAARRPGLDPIRRGNHHLTPT